MNKTDKLLGEVSRKIENSLDEYALKLARKKLKRLNDNSLNGEQYNKNMCLFNVLMNY